MPFPRDWTLPSPIRKRFLHSRENLTRYCNIFSNKEVNDGTKHLTFAFKLVFIIGFCLTLDFSLWLLGFSFWLQVICLTFWRYWPQHVPCWQRSVQLFCTCSGFHNTRNLPIPWRAWDFSLLSHRYLTSIYTLLVLHICLFLRFIHVFLLPLKCRVLWNILLSKRLSVSLPPHSRRKTTTWHWSIMDRQVWKAPAK